MAKRLKIDARLKSQGLFWDAQNPNAVFPGQLLRQGRRIELTSAPSPADISDVFKAFGSNAQPRLAAIQGTTQYGDCTLLGLIPTDGGSYLNTTRALNAGFTTNKFLVSTAIMGLHLTGPTDPVLKSATLTYGGLKGWAPQCAESQSRMTLRRSRIPRQHQWLT